jgi:hypothetical protein
VIAASLLPAAWRLAGRRATEGEETPGKLELTPFFAPLKSLASRHRETRVTGEGLIPCGTGAAEVSRAAARLVEFCMPAAHA